MTEKKKTPKELIAEECPWEAEVEEGHLTEDQLWEAAREGAFAAARAIEGKIAELTGGNVDKLGCCVVGAGVTAAAMIAAFMASEKPELRRASMRRFAEVVSYLEGKDEKEQVIVIPIRVKIVPDEPEEKEPAN